ncbi:hypothetical protein D9M71_724900 [compost metagenome]
MRIAPSQRSQHLELPRRDPIGLGQLAQFTLQHAAQANHPDQQVGMLQLKVRPCRTPFRQELVHVVISSHAGILLEAKKFAHMYLDFK